MNTAITETISVKAGKKQVFLESIGERA